MKIVSIIGARPQFIKASPVSRLLRINHCEVLVHTGQHYDDNMSAVFFNELDIPEPEYHLGIGSASHGAQTGAMLEAIERVLLIEKPDWVLVYGDTNSTLAGALAASKLQIKIAHIEAGLRSFNRAMPEEVNRVLTDHLAHLLLCPSQIAVENLAREGLTQRVYLVGDVMADTLAYARFRSKDRSKILSRYKLKEKGFLLVTIHRAENTDNVERLSKIVNTLCQLEEPVIFPVHPRTRKVLKCISVISEHCPLILIDPVGYLDMIRLEEAARMILTDSGGIQKEAYWLQVPCVTLRNETEWVETAEAGWNMLVGANQELILRAIRSFQPPVEHPILYGDGCTAQRCINLMTEQV